MIFPSYKYPYNIKVHVKTIKRIEIQNNNIKYHSITQILQPEGIV